MLLTYFVDSLSNPLFIVTICVPKRRVKTMCVDYQVFMSPMSRVGGVENGERMWNYSPKVGELPKYNKLRYQVTAIFADTTKNYGSRTNGKIKKY